MSLLPWKVSSDPLCEALQVISSPSKKKGLTSYLTAASLRPPGAGWWVLLRPKALMLPFPSRTACTTATESLGGPGTLKSPSTVAVASPASPGAPGLAGSSLSSARSVPLHQVKLQPIPGTISPPGRPLRAMSGSQAQASPLYLLAPPEGDSWLLSRDSEASGALEMRGPSWGSGRGCTESQSPAGGRCEGQGPRVRRSQTYRVEKAVFLQVPG